MMNDNPFEAPRKKSFLLQSMSAFSSFRSFLTFKLHQIRSWSSSGSVAKTSNLTMNSDFLGESLGVPNYGRNMATQRSMPNKLEKALEASKSERSMKGDDVEELSTPKMLDLSQELLDQGSESNNPRFLKMMNKQNGGSLGAPMPAKKKGPTRSPIPPGF